MPHCHVTSSAGSSFRRGIATLEFAMALPILLLLMVALTWLGFSMIARSQVLVEARNNAWKKRFDNKGDQPLHFPILPGYDRDADFVTETAKKTVDVSPVFKSAKTPEGSFTVLAGSWDHKAMPFDEPPDLKLMATAAAVGWGGKYLDFFSQITNPLGALSELGSGLKSEAGNASNVVGKDDGSSNGGAGTGNPGTPNGGLTPDQAKEKTEAERKKAIDDQLKRYHALGGRLDPTSDRVEVLDGGELKKSLDAIKEAQKADQDKSEAARNEKDNEKKKKLQEESAAAHRKVELLKIEDARLQAEFRDVIDELDALGINKWELFYGFK